MVEAKVDNRQVFAGLDLLKSEFRVKLARSMAVAGGTVIRDEAKMRAPKGETGNLQQSIYLAYRDTQSTEARVKYSVSWNHKTAPHGHLIEFGHWQPYVTVKIGDEWVTTTKLRKHPKFIPATPFLRPAYHAALPRAKQAMLNRGRDRLAELLREQAK